jgi:outer membrane protein TolC
MKDRIKIITLIFICFLGQRTLVTAQNTLFTDSVLTLRNAIDMALDNNFDIRIARNNEDIADIENNWGNAGRLPTVSGGAGYTYSSNNLKQKLTNGTEIIRNGASFQNQNANVSAQWRLYNGGRVLAAKDRLDELEKISNLQWRDQANQVVYQVITAYLNILRFEKQRETTMEIIQLFEERMKLAENRFTIGVAGKSDYLQAVADLNVQKSLIIQIENNLAISKTLLNNQLARDPGTPFTVSFQIAEVTLAPLAILAQGIDTLNPQLLINKSEAVVLAKQYKEINALRLPTVSLNAGANFNNSQNSAGFTLQNTTYGPNAGIQLAVPIFQGGVIKQQMRVNKVLQNTQVIGFQRIRNDLLSSLNNAYVTYQNAKRQHELELGNLDVIRENTQIAMERFKKASITTVEFRQTQIDLVESQTRVINAVYLMKQAEADILVIMGKLVE